MGFLSRGLSGQKALNTYDVFKDLLNHSTSASGKTVSPKTAIEVAAVFACLRVRANGLAQVPLKLMRESADGKTRTPAKDHPLFPLLKSRPNDWQTSFEYREMLSFHLDLCGNHYSFVNRSNRAGIMELIPFEPGSVTVKRDDNFTLSYDVRAENGSIQNFPAKAIWHVRGPSWNSWMGLEAVQIAREAIGLSMAIEEQQARIQRNGVRVPGIYSVDGSLSPVQYKHLKTWIDENIGGPENAGKPMLLDRAAKWTSTAMTGIDAETLSTRRFQVEEICRHFQVNPIMVFAESKNTTYASAEQMFLSHVVHTLAPTYMRLEQSIDANLLTDKDRESGIYACFVDEGLLRGSMKDKMESLLGYKNGGVITANEARAKLDLNPDKDPESDKLHNPANITGNAQPPKDRNDPKDDRMADLELKFAQISAKSVAPSTAPVVNVTLNQEPVNFTHESGPTNVTAPISIHNAVPEQRSAPITIQNDVHVPEGAVPIVNNTVNVPQQAAPVVNTAVHVPQQAAPVVHNNVLVPELKAPNVTFEAVLPALTVVAQLPARKTHSETTVTRGKDGNINGSVTHGTEEDVIPRI